VINHSVDFSDVIIAATAAQLKIALEKLKMQAFGLKELAEALEEAVANFTKVPTLEVGGRRLDLAQKPLIMGILNVTPDSFYDGGRYPTPEIALKKAEEMLTAGADIIDVGGESSRPGSKPVSEKDEQDRVIPIIEKISQKFKPPISIDTTKAAVAKAALEAGAAIINDISALRFDSRMAELASRSGAGLILMHLQGTPENMQTDPHYEDIICEISDFFKERIAFAVQAGIKKEQIILDPGIGFGKTVEHNLEIIRHLSSFKILGRPILVGLSRKSFIGKILGLEPKERLEGSLAAAVAAALNGAQILRVHDVGETIRAVKIIRALQMGEIS
jgi:dihydropteroate synthase